MQCSHRSTCILLWRDACAPMHAHACPYCPTALPWLVTRQRGDNPPLYQKGLHSTPSILPFGCKPPAPSSLLRGCIQPCLPCLLERCSCHAATASKMSTPYLVGQWGDEHPGGGLFGRRRLPCRHVPAGCHGVLAEMGLEALINAHAITNHWGTHQLGQAVLPWPLFTR